MENTSSLSLQTDSYKKCVDYLDARLFGLCSHFRQGYLTVAAYSLFELLRYFIDTDPEFLFSADIKKLTDVLGIRLPDNQASLDAWVESDLNLTSIKIKIAISYGLLQS